MSVGHGFPTKILVGPLITMDVGRAWLITAGSGFQATISNGVRPGFHGVPAGVISAGRLCHREDPELPMQVYPSVARWTVNSISAPPIHTFSLFLNLGYSVCSAGVFVP